MTVLINDTPFSLINDTRLADLNEVVKALGSKSADSVLAKPQMALAIVYARADGVIGDDAGPSTYDTYLEGRRSVLANSTMGAGIDDGGYKANVSKNTQLIRAAGLPGIEFPNVLTRSTGLRAALVANDEKCKPPFDAYVDLARAQLKSPGEKLSDQEIIAVILKKDAAEKGLIDKLIAAYKVARNLNEAFNVQSMSDVVAAYEDAIAEAGGEVPAITKDEKDAAKAMAFLASKGLRAVSNVTA